MKRKSKLALSIERSIKRANKKYNNATPAQRRVMIAKDVLERLKNRTIRATPGSWVVPISFEPKQVVSMQEVIHRKNPVNCEVCGVGGLVLGAIFYRNKVSVNELGELSDSVGNQLKPSELLGSLTEFSARQKVLIELAFESGLGYYRVSRDIPNDAYGSRAVKHTNATKAARDWVEKYELLNDDTARLAAIMKNIIRNKGTFNPFQK